MEPTEFDRTTNLGDLIVAAFDASAEVTKNPELAAELATWLVARVLVADLRRADPALVAVD
jgi:hypothetical protein